MLTTQASDRTDTRRTGMAGHRVLGGADSAPDRGREAGPACPRLGARASADTQQADRRPCAGDGRARRGRAPVRGGDRRRGDPGVRVQPSAPGRRRPGTPREDAALRDHVASTSLPVFVHAVYLINLGSPDPLIRRRSAASLAYSPRRGREIGARGVIVHTGSAVRASREQGMRHVRDCLLPLLDSLGDDGPDLPLEPTAGRGQLLCATAGGPGPYLAAVDWHPRAGLCLDTCHAFAAGHDLTARGGVARLLDTLAPIVGRRPGPGSGRLGLIHANDSKDGCGPPPRPAREHRGRPDRDRAVRGSPASPGDQRRAVHRRDSRAACGRGGGRGHPEGAAREAPSPPRPRRDALGCSRAQAVLVLVRLPARHPDGRPPDPALTRNDLKEAPAGTAGASFFWRAAVSLTGDRRTRWSW
jgi:endonuclease IV